MNKFRVGGASQLKFGFISLFVLAVSINASYACRCTRTSVEQNYKNALVILEGKILWTFDENHSDPNFPRVIVKDTYAAIQFTKVLNYKSSLSNTDIAAIESIMMHKKVKLIEGWVNTGNSCRGYDLTTEKEGASVIVAFRPNNKDDTFEKLFNEFDTVGPCSLFNEFFVEEQDVQEYRDFKGAK